MHRLPAHVCNRPEQGGAVAADVSAAVPTPDGEAPLTFLPAHAERSQKNEKFKGETTKSNFVRLGSKSSKFVRAQPGNAEGAEKKNVE